MFNDENNRSDALGQRLQKIGGQMNPSPALKKAAKTGVPLRSAGIRYTAGTHVRKFTKAVLLYVACIALFLGTILMIPKWFGGNGPVAESGSSDRCNHKYVALTMGLAPSCTEGTIHVYRCQYCGHSYSEQDPAPGHNIVDGVCTRCGEKEAETPSLSLDQFGDPAVINSVLNRMGLQFDKFANETPGEVKDFLGRGEVDGFLVTYYYTCEKLSPMELYYSFGEKRRMTNDDIASLKPGQPTQAELAADWYCFTGKDALALLTQYAAVEPTWSDQLRAMLLAYGYYYDADTDTFYNCAIDPSCMLAYGIHVTGCAQMKSGELVVFYATFEGEKRMVILKSDGDNYRFAGNCPTDYLYRDGTEPMCEHGQDPTACPYCNCDEHVWITSENTATCTEDGIRERTCQKCGYAEIIEVKAYGHDYHFGTCSRCDDTLPPLEITIPIPDPGKMSAELEAEIIAASAKQYDEIATDFSIEFVADLGDGAYAIFVDGPWHYPAMETEQIVHGYLFWYSSGRTMQIYKDGAVYGLSKAYDQGVIDANQVLDLYLIYADQMGYLSVRNPEKKYSNATSEYHFVDNQICIWVFSEYNSYQYTANDFSEINCIELYESPWQNYEDGKSLRRILLTLDENSKQNVLDCIQILQLRVDIQAADVNLLEYAE